jgi:hypothetical protein
VLWTGQHLVYKTRIASNITFLSLGRKYSKCLFHTREQGRPLGGASGALAPGADFEGAPKRRSSTGHTLIRSTVAW